MYRVFIVILLSIAAALALRGLYRKNVLSICSGFVLIAATLWAFNFQTAGGETFEFDASGNAGCLRSDCLYQMQFALIGSVIAFGILRLLTFAALDRSDQRVRWIPPFLGFYLGGKWAAAQWETILLYLTRPDSGIRDPLLNKDVGFYLFRLPFYEQVYLILLAVLVLGVLSSLAGLFLSFRDGRLECMRPSRTFDGRPKPGRWVYVNLSFLLLLLAWGQYLSRFDLLYVRCCAAPASGWTGLNRVSAPAPAWSGFGQQTPCTSALYPESFFCQPPTAASFEPPQARVLHSDCFGKLYIDDCILINMQSSIYNRSPLQRGDSSE